MNTTYFCHQAFAKGYRLPIAARSIRYEEEIPQTAGTTARRWRQTILDPNSWRAVGEAEGWNLRKTKRLFFEMFDYLWAGGTPDDYLSTIPPHITEPHPKP